MNSLRIRFSLHALLKFEVLRAYGLDLDPKLVGETVLRPRRVVPGYGGRQVAQGPLDDRRVLRVVFEQTADEIVIVTFYPGERARYEKDTL